MKISFVRSLGKVALSLCSVIVMSQPLAAEAALNLPAPEVLLEQAAEGRAQLREVLLDLQQNTPELRDPETFDRYFFLLKDLEKLAIEQRLDEIYPKAVALTGLRMVGHGIRWMDLTQRSLEEALYYLEYADADVAGRLISESDVQMRTLQASTRTAAQKYQFLRQMAENLDGMIPTVEAKYAERRDIQIELRSLLSGLAIEFLKLKTIGEDEVLFWIAKISLPGSYSDFITVMHDSIFAIEIDPKSPSTHDDLSQVANRLLLLGKKLERETMPLPRYVTSSWGDAVVELIGRTLQTEGAFAENEFETLLRLMKTRQVQSLGSHWLSSERVPSTGYARTYFKMSQAVVARLQQAGLTREASDVKKFVSRLAAPLQGQLVKIEGLYRLSSRDGQSLNFSVIYARNNLLYAALGYDNGVITKAYFNVTYDLDKN
ncbi:MAG: hypothetical protein RBT63_09990, partial [Bdellovibrionales bacterium]|nr:hypothetical protein [Bdellovibrionales bacterium]